jgi:hypothetical protein
VLRKKAVVYYHKVGNIRHQVAHFYFKKTKFRNRNASFLRDGFDTELRVLHATSLTLRSHVRDVGTTEEWDSRTVASG